VKEARVKDIEERARKAAPGPWIINRYNCDNGAINWQVQQEGDEAEVISNVAADEVRTARATATFIASARSDVPALCAALREERATIARHEAEIARLRTALAAASTDLAGGYSRRAVMVKTAIDIVLAGVPS